MSAKHKVERILVTDFDLLTDESFNINQFLYQYSGLGLVQ